MENPLIFDHEPIATRLPFRYNDIKKEEDNTMNKTEFVTHVIHCSEEYPDVGELTLESADNILANAYPGSVPDMTPAEFVHEWSKLLRDPSVFNIDGEPRRFKDQTGVHRQVGL